MHYKQDEREDVKLDYTKIDVDSIELTNDEMRELRNYTYVPVYNDADRKKLYDSLTKEQQNKLKGLTQKQVKNVLNNILYRDKIEGKRINDIDRTKDLEIFVKDPSQVYTGIDTKGYTVNELDGIANLAYEPYCEKIKDKNEEEKKKKIAAEQKKTGEKFREKGLEIKIFINDPKSNLQGYILETKSKEIIVSFRGTEGIFNLKDVGNDLQLSLGNNKQYRKAYEIITDYIKSNKLENKLILFTGHSLGGGIANYLMTRIPNTQSIVFDPVPVVLDETIKNERNIRKISGLDSTGFKDGYIVAPNRGLLNGTYINENGQKENFNNVQFLKLFALDNPNSNFKRKFLKTEYISYSAYQNSTNKREYYAKQLPIYENYPIVKKLKKAMKEGDTEKIKELASNQIIKEYWDIKTKNNYLEQLDGHHQNHKVDDKANSYANTTKKGESKK